MNADTWATIADLGTAAGTLVLAVATFSAVRSGNRTARAAEQSLLTSLRPLLMPSKLSDEPLKVNFGDSKWLVGDTGFWQGAIRDPADPRYEMARTVIESRGDWFVGLLYGDYDGGQRTISRFRCQYRPRPSAAGSGGASGSGEPEPGDEKQGATTWLATVARHWSLDQPDPRSSDREAYL